MRIKIIVEGKSDEIFLKAVFRKFDIRGINIEISGGKNKCEITKPKTIKKIIENAKEDGYEKIIILIDKRTQFNCGIINSSCVLDVKREYKKRVLKELMADVVVVDEEIECWFILGEKINNYYENCYENAKNLFSTDSQQQLAQRAVKKLDSILQNRDKNRSFDYFLRKIGI
jgi:hypothetical protein